MPNAWIYKRYSDKEQEKGDSIRRQTDLANAFAARHNLIIVGEYVDRGVSSFRGKNATKGELFRFFRDVESGRIVSGSWLLFEDFDRLDRRQLTHAFPSFLDLVEKNGIVVGTTQDGRIYTKHNINQLDVALTLVIKQILANAESNKKADRLREKWDQRRENGFKSAVCPAWIMLNEEGEYELREERVPTIRKIFELAETGLGSTSIVRILNSDPSTPPFEHKHGNRGKMWHVTTVSKILNGRHVLGEFQYYKTVNDVPEPVGEPRKGWYPAVISEHQWLKVQALRKTKPRGRRSNKVSNLFPEIMHCRSCGGPMKVKPCKQSKNRTSGRDYSYFVCRNALAGNGCKGKMYFPLELVENAILDHTHEYRLHALFADPKAADELKGVEAAIGNHEIKIAELERLKSNLNGRIAKLNSDDPLGHEWSETVRTYMADIRQSQDVIKALEQRRLILTSRIDQRTDAEANVKALRAEMATIEGDDLLVLRTRLSYAVKDFITAISFDPVRGFIKVRINGIVAIRVAFARDHLFQVRNGKGRNAGRKVEYLGKITVDLPKEVLTDAVAL
jgi:DNA invertase Pin-like site-specific DNA recombinase